MYQIVLNGNINDDRNLVTRHTTPTFTPNPTPTPKSENKHMPTSNKNSMSLHSNSPIHQKTMHV